MPHIGRYATFLAFVAIASCHRATVVPVPSVSADATTLKALLDSTAQAWNRGDLPGYLSVYVDSAMEVLPSGLEHGRSAIETTMKTGYWKTGRPLQAVHYENVEVRPLGRRYALMTGRFVLTGGGRPNTTGVFTTLWLRTEAGWKMFYDHSG